MRALRSPALHFVLIGLALFAWSGERGASGERERLEIPRSTIANARLGFEKVSGRPPTAEEARTLTDTLIDQEILFRYAMGMGLLEEPVVRRRLAQLGSFVGENRRRTTTEDERANEAIELGLHHGDLVVRRIMIDMARRLIRAPWLVRAPDDATLQAYLDTHGERFRAPARTRITQVAVNRLKHGIHSEERARAIAEILRSGAYPPQEAGALGDELQMASSLPLLSHPDLARKFGHRLATAVEELPEGEWSEPIPSIYGLHVVYVHERAPAYVPSLEDVRDRVRRRFLQDLADQWLALRLAQLRAGFEIVLPDPVAS